MGVTILQDTNTLNTKTNSMAQKTAVEWLASEINRRGPIENNPPKWLQELYEEAKEMEKEQIIEANIAGMEFIAVDPSRYQQDAEQYYNETYIK